MKKHIRRGSLVAGLAGLFVALLAGAAYAGGMGRPMQEPSDFVPDPGNTAWVLVSTALVLFMTPGLALFYGGMVRAKNVLGMLMQNFFAMGILAVLWVVRRVQPRVRRRGQRRVRSATSTSRS